MSKKALKKSFFVHCLIRSAHLIADRWINEFRSGVQRLRFYESAIFEFRSGSKNLGMLNEAQRSIIGAGSNILKSKIVESQTLKSTTARKNKSIQ